ncbi:MAG: hypothetical protein WCA15_17115 [Candidatus Acidiferrales bacterium]
MRRWLIVGVVAIVAFIVVLYTFTPAIKTAMRKRTEANLRARFQSDIEFSHFDVFLFPHVRVTIDGLTLRLQGRTDVPPLIQIQHVKFTASISGMLRKQFTIRDVELDGLQIHMPPKDSGARPKIHGTETDLAEKYPVLIHEIDANNALISILRGDPGKPPREFPIHELVIKDFSFDNPASFHAVLTNPVPKGLIDCAGQFGPWNAEDPRHTPVAAQFTFSDADMSTIRGLSGILHSTGKFSGPLDYLNVEGQTETPDFALRMSGHPVDLHTDYTAIVDGTNGNVILKPVIAHFRHTTLVVNGEVADLTPEKGRTILLDAVSREATIEDLLYLTVKNDPPIMTGPATINAKIDIGEGDADILQRMTVDGQFGVADARFTSSNVQGKIDALSRRAQGHPGDKDIDDVVSNLSAKFRVDKGVASFSKLSFGVPGANVALTGSYGLDSGVMDFHGHLLMQAKLSQTTTGAKSFFLKAVDPFFKGKNDGTDLPIKIAGTKDHPSFGLDLHHDEAKKN